MGKTSTPYDEVFTLLTDESNHEDEGADRVGRAGGFRRRLLYLRQKRQRRSNRQRIARRPRRVPLANLSQILALLLFPETTHLRRYVDRPWLGPLRRSLLRFFQEPRQVPCPRGRMASKRQRWHRKRHRRVEDHRPLAVQQAPPSGARRRPDQTCLQRGLLRAVRWTRLHAQRRRRLPRHRRLLALWLGSRQPPKGHAKHASEAPGQDLDGCGLEGP